MEQGIISALNERLVGEIRNSVQDEIILDAFRHVPRHTFVPSFYDRVSPTKREWRLISSSMHQDEWLEKVYTDRPLTISLDANNYPDSSSSQPDLMASMIQSVQIQRGHRVLEVGTGTGYNAAVLASLVGPEHVVSIDIRKPLLDAAQTRIEQTVGPGVTLVHADGRNVPVDLKNFDAIIATGSHERIEPSWLRALAPGGRIVFNWIQGFANVMIEAKKCGDRLSGHVCEYGGDFMHLHNGNGVDHTIPPAERLPVIAHIEFRPQLFSSLTIGFFLQINKPSLSYHRYRGVTSGELSYMVCEAQRGHTVYFCPGKIRGNASLWEEIQAIYETYEHVLKPCPSMFSVDVDEHSMTFFYKEQAFVVPFSIPPA